MKSDVTTKALLAFTLITLTIGFGITGCSNVQTKSAPGSDPGLVALRVKVDEYSEVVRQIQSLVAENRQAASTCQSALDSRDRTSLLYSQNQVLPRMKDNAITLAGLFPKAMSLSDEIHRDPLYGKHYRDGAPVVDPNKPPFSDWPLGVNFLRVSIAHEGS